ncbi:MAG: carboxypeptidase-like regulatory domain-containing protein [Hymenobacteraceae bacterium]|nr:carboxypeptidase-like regulatory domain-containing protein [Hymenobacteraceae bacterium]
MKNFSALAFVIVLLSAPISVSAQTKLSGRTAVAVETNAMPAQPAAVSPTVPSSAPAAAAPQEAQEEEGVNIVLFTGTVKQDKLKALPGATVYVKTTRQMAVADENGDFSLELDFSSGPLELEVSYAGFSEQSVTITDPNTFLVVSMQGKKKK